MFSFLYLLKKKGLEKEDLQATPILRRRSRSEQLIIGARDLDVNVEMTFFENLYCYYCVLPFHAMK